MSHFLRDFAAKIRPRFPVGFRKFTHPVKECTDVWLAMLRRKATVRAPLEDPSKLVELAQSYANGRSASFRCFIVL
jgi:hypothetical protein